MIWPTKKQYIPVSRTDIKLCFPNKVWEELTGMIDRFQCSKVSHLLSFLLFSLVALSSHYPLTIGASKDQCQLSSQTCLLHPDGLYICIYCIYRQVIHLTRWCDEHSIKWNAEVLEAQMLQLDLRGRDSWQLIDNLLKWGIGPHKSLFLTSIFPVYFLVVWVTLIWFVEFEFLCSARMFLNIDKVRTGGLFKCCLRIFRISFLIWNDSWVTPICLIELNMWVPKTADEKT